MVTSVASATTLVTHGATRAATPIALRRAAARTDTMSAQTGERGASARRTAHHTARCAPPANIRTARRGSSCSRASTARRAPKATLGPAPGRGTPFAYRLRPTVTYPYIGTHPTAIAPRPTATCHPTGTPPPIAIAPTATARRARHPAPPPQAALPPTRAEGRR